MSQFRAWLILGSSRKPSGQGSQLPEMLFWTSSQPSVMSHSSQKQRPCTLGEPHKRLHSQRWLSRGPGRLLSERSYEDWKRACLWWDRPGGGEEVGESSAGSRFSVLDVDLTALHKVRGGERLIKWERYFYNISDGVCFPAPQTQRCWPNFSPTKEQFW